MYRALESLKSCYWVMSIRIDLGRNLVYTVACMVDMSVSIVCKVAGWLIRQNAMERSTDECLVHS